MHLITYYITQHTRGSTFPEIEYVHNVTYQTKTQRANLILVRTYYYVAIVTVCFFARKRYYPSVTE